MEAELLLQRRRLFWMDKLASFFPYSPPVWTRARVVTQNTASHTSTRCCECNGVRRCMALAWQQEGTYTFICLAPVRCLCGVKGGPDGNVNTEQIHHTGLWGKWARRNSLDQRCAFSTTLDVWKHLHTPETS